MARATDKAGTALKRLSHDAILPGGLAAPRTRVGWRLSLSCGAVAFALALPAGKAAAAPLVLEVADARAGFDPRQSSPNVAIRLPESSKRLFADFTSRQKFKTVEIRFNGRIISKARISGPTLDGTAVFGPFNITEAKDIASRLSTGSAKLEVEAISE